MFFNDTSHLTMTPVTGIEGKWSVNLIILACTNFHQITAQLVLLYVYELFIFIKKEPIQNELYYPYLQGLTQGWY